MHCRTPSTWSPYRRLMQRNGGSSSWSACTRRPQPATPLPASCCSAAGTRARSQEGDRGESMTISGRGASVTRTPRPTFARGTGPARVQSFDRPSPRRRAGRGQRRPDRATPDSASPAAAGPGRVTAEQSRTSVPPRRYRPPVACLPRGYSGPSKRPPHNLTGCGAISGISGCDLM